MIPADKSKPQTQPTLPKKPPTLAKKGPTLNGVTIEQLEEALKVLEEF